MADRRCGWTTSRLTPCACARPVHSGHSCRSTFRISCRSMSSPLMLPDAVSSSRQLLRHTVATLAYRAEKVLKDTPDTFVNHRLSSTSRTPLEIVAHMGDLREWAHSI